MTKADIVNEITKNTGIDKVTVLTTLEAFMDTVKDSLSKEENVYLRGFGSFVVKKRAQKTARNISKNTTIISHIGHAVVLTRRFSSHSTRLLHIVGSLAFPASW